MRIAFTSCVCTTVFPNQPVWNQIAAQQPDHLVLLGDSLYLDINTPTHPQDMDDDSFGRHLFSRYSELLAQRDFLTLVKQMKPSHVHSIWDDHDFLWNDVWGADAFASPIQRDKARVSTAFCEAFRVALASALTPGSFPSVYNDPAFWNPDQPPLTTPSVQLADDVWLHLCDVRSFRTRTWLVAEENRTLLGDTQRKQIGAVAKNAIKAVHLVASASTIAGWRRYARDRNWLMDLASSSRTIILSGDIHRNEVDAFYTGGFPLHEVTSSGAAVRDAVVLGAERQNFAQIDKALRDLGVSVSDDN